MLITIIVLAVLLINGVILGTVMWAKKKDLEIEITVLHKRVDRLAKSNQELNSKFIKLRLGNEWYNKFNQKREIAAKLHRALSDVIGSLPEQDKTLIHANTVLKLPL